MVCKNSETFIENGFFSIIESKQVRQLIQRECCNYEDGGFCIMMDDGDRHKCPQTSANHIVCNWFEEAVLPLNIDLHNKLTNDPNQKIQKKCTVCGKPISAKSNRAKYCPKCASKVHIKKTVQNRQKKTDHMLHLEPLEMVC